MSVRILIGDVRERLRDIPDESVHCIVTSPPYWGLRDYGVAGQIGLEPTLGEFIENIVGVFRDARRVLRKDGTLWLNLGDAYAGSWGAQSREHAGKHAPNVSALSANQVKAAGIRASGTGSAARTPGLKAKDRMMIPARVALALQDDGWWLRDEIVWAKPNPMPSSVADRTTPAHEMIYLLSRSARYFYDGEAIREPFADSSIARLSQPTISEQAGGDKQDAYEAAGLNARTGSRRPNEIVAGLAQKITRKPAGWDTAEGAHSTLRHTSGKSGNKERKLGVDRGRPDSHIGGSVPWEGTTRNKRSVWTIATEPFPESHFACVDAATEALTPTGWKTHEELADGDLIAAYDPDHHRLTWQPATFHRYPFAGELVAVEKRDSSQRLTLNHRCLVRRRGRPPTVALAENLKPGMQIPTTAPLHVASPSGGPGEAMAALLGWYLTEGEKRRHRTIRINQSLSANPAHVATIRHLLESTGAEFTERTRERSWRGRPSVEVTFTVGGSVASSLFALSPEKRADWTWLAWSDAELHALLNAVIDGDGHRRDDGRASIIQKDRQFLDAMQAVALRLGMRAYLSERQGGIFVLYLTKGDWLTLRSTDGVHRPLGREWYEGVVWCPAVASTFWLARRAGRTFITGNTFPTALIEPCIKAGCPEGGTVLDPFFGAGTTGLVADRLGRNCIGIELNPEYAAMAERRVRGDSPLFAEVAHG